MKTHIGTRVVVRDLEKDFIHGDSPVPVLREVSFEVAPGECLALCGLSGVGKSTLLRLIAGLINISGGSIHIDGQKVDRPIDELGFVTQDYSRSLLPWLTVEKNVMLPFRGRKIAKSERQTRVAEVLESVGLADVADYYPWQLSGGMQQRVAIARALVSRPRLLLLDEPFASLDAHTRMELEDLVSKLVNSAGITTILVTHDMEEAIYMADRVLVLAGSPATISREMNVDIPRPREQLETRGLDQFNALRRELYFHLRK